MDTNYSEPFIIRYTDNTDLQDETFRQRRFIAHNKDTMKRDGKYIELW